MLKATDAGRRHDARSPVLVLLALGLAMAPILREGGGGGSEGPTPTSVSRLAWIETGHGQARFVALDAPAGQWHRCPDDSFPAAGSSPLAPDKAYAMMPAGCLAEIPPPAPAAPFLFAPIPINEASPEILATIPGIGPELARRIVEFREREGRFISRKDLEGVEGIGAKRAGQILPRIRF